MAKNAVYLPSIFKKIDDGTLKRLALLFDKICINKVFGYDGIQDAMSVPIPEEIAEMVSKVLIDFEYLINNKIVITTELFSPHAVTDEMRQQFSPVITDYINLGKSLAASTDQEEKENISEDLTTKARDLFTRMEAAVLSINQTDEFYPIIKSAVSFQTKGRKENIIQFLLNNFPEPDVNTPWEQIIDFRSDVDTLLKYKALINWINDIAKSDYSVGEIKDKYEYLYLDYKRGYERHKIKSSLGTLEIIVAASTAFFTNNIPAALSLASNFLKIGTSSLNLLKEEGNLPGKEIAYIYHANKKFGMANELSVRRR